MATRFHLLDVLLDLALALFESFLAHFKKVALQENYLSLNNNSENNADSHPVVTTCVSTRVLVLPCASVMTVVVFVVFLLPSMLNSVFTSFLPPGGTSELSAGAAYLGLG